ncbi:MAG: formamidopyrimidine-DNA glycosylase [Planctomycetales bacterium]|nr:formamidopyrimidine-DNA glycosylase [Planctomycetales bacterium]
MPELPDVIVYREALERHFGGRTLARVDLKSPFVVRTFEPDVSQLAGRKLLGVERLGKRLVWRMEGGLLVVFHLMIAGRFHLRKPGALPRSKADLAAFHFGEDEIDASFFMTEATPKKSVSLHLLEGEAGLRAFDRSGLDVIGSPLEAFRERLLCENHTLKRSLTTPRLFDGIGNAYSDEILHRAGLSPLTWTTRLEDKEIERLHAACCDVLGEWTMRLRQEVGDGFPEKVTAFRPEMAVHGKHQQPCPVCGSPVQRIRYVDNETNYCARCQTGGRLLADRSLSRLLKGDWPKTIEEWEG